MKCFALFVLCSCFTVNFAQNHEHFHGNDNQGLNDNQSNSSFHDHDISSNQAPGEKLSEKRELDQSEMSFEDQLTLANQSANDWHAHMHVDHIFNSSSQLEEVAFKESGYFIEKLFKKYGSHNSLPFPGLRQLMKNIGLASEDDQSMEGAESQISDDRKSMEGDGSQMDDDRESMEGGSGQMSDDGESMDGSENQMYDDGESIDGKSNLKKEDGRQGERKLRSRRAITHTHSDHSKCHHVKELLTAFHFDLFDGLDLDRFLLLCPALIDQLDNSGCHLHVSHDIYENSVVDSDHEDHSQSHEHEDHEGHDHAESEKSPVASGGIGDVPPLVWVYSSVAVLGISLVGLLGVAAIPIIRKMFYKSLLQFLVALAVGALSGDALLHLLPHALSGSHNSHKHSNSHSSSSTSDSNSSSSNINNNNSITTTSSDDNHDDLESVWKGMVALGGLLFFFVAERVLTIVGHRREKRRIKRKLEEELEPRGLQTLYFAQDDPSDNIRETAILTDDDDDNNTTSALTSTHHHHHHHHRNSNHHHDHHQNGMEGHQKHDFPPQGQGHDHGGHGHSHHHGDAPGSLTAVAAMVIMGDGIHNFSDGLAIGAAFAAGMTGGFSTTVAVFCHELPHEIGDFAMLLSAGMSIKHAVMYNVLSSILCFVGMVIGVVLGQVENASSWIFCGVAGMFLYISMADMLPQLTIRVEKGLASPCQQLMLQCAGVSIGAGIMLTIAIFEHDLKTLIDIS